MAIFHGDRCVRRPVVRGRRVDGKRSRSRALRQRRDGRVGNLSGEIAGVAGFACGERGARGTARPDAGNDDRIWVEGDRGSRRRSRGRRWNRCRRRRRGGNRSRSRSWSGCRRRSGGGRRRGPGGGRARWRGRGARREKACASREPPLPKGAWTPDLAGESKDPADSHPEGAARHLADSKVAWRHP